MSFIGEALLGPCILILLFLTSKVCALEIGITPFEPMVYCKVGETRALSYLKESKKDESFRGYDIDLLINLANLKSMNLNSVNVRCYNPADLAANVRNRFLDFGTGGIPITSSRLQQGFEFSLPTYTSGIKLAVRTSSDSNLWSFFLSFDITLWVMILFTTLFTGIITWLFEDQTFSCKYSKRCFNNFSEMIWQAFSSLFYTSEIRLQKFSARIVFLCFWFMVLVLTATYTADLTTKLSSRNPKSLLSIDDARKAKDLTVYTYKEYLELLTLWQSKIVPVERTKEGTDEIKELFMRNDGVNKAILLDSPFIDYFSSQHSCSVYVINEPVSNFNYGFLFYGMSAEDAKTINLSLFSFKESPEIQTLTKKHINVFSIENDCDTNEKSLTLQQLAGLWIIIASVVLFALIFELARYLYRRYKTNYGKIKTFSRTLTLAEEKKKNYLDSYLMISDYIHIPSKDLHLKIEEDIRNCVDSIEKFLKKKFDEIEEKVLQMSKNSNKREKDTGESNKSEEKLVEVADTEGKHLIAKEGD